MFSLFNTTRKTIIFMGCFVLVIFAVALTLSVKTNSQQLQVLNQTDKDLLLKQVESSPEQPVNVIESNNTPLKISNATAKEISGSDFTKLTGKVTDLVTVASFPEATLVNHSGKTITGFVFGIRDPKTKTLQTVNQQKIAIAPGATYNVKREHFLKPEKTTTATSEGVSQKLILPKADSEKYWVDFAQRSDFYVTIGIVFFEDGSRWALKSEDGLK